MPFPNADKSMTVSNSSTGEGGLQIEAFAAALRGAGISTDAYTKCTVLALDDESWSAFTSEYGSLFTPAQIKQILEYHIIPTEPVFLFGQGATFRQTHKTLQGEDVEITGISVGEIYISNVGAVEADGSFSEKVGAVSSFGNGNDMGVKNGVIQLLSNALIPPALQNVLPTPTDAPFTGTFTGTFPTFTGTFPTETFTGTFPTETMGPEPTGMETGTPRTTTRPSAADRSRAGGVVVAAFGVLAAALVVF